MARAGHARRGSRIGKDHDERQRHTGSRVAATTPPRVTRLRNALAAEVAAVELAHPGWLSPDAPTGKVASGVGATGSARHEPWGRPVRSRLRGWGAATTAELDGAATTAELGG